jgi:hypothetical protein
MAAHAGGMMRAIILSGLLAGQAQAQTIPGMDAARAAARQVDQTVQEPRIGKESMDRTYPLLTVEPHADPGKSEADEAAWKKAKEAEAKKALEAKPE